MNLTKSPLYLALALMASVSTSCLDEGHETIILEDATVKTPGGIPSDEYAEPNPAVSESNSLLPNPTTSVDVSKLEPYAVLEMTGIVNPLTGEWLRLYGTRDKRQNVWLSVDGEPKGIDVINLIDSYKDYTLVNDVVFLVDNSESMAEEADAIAESITSWASSLSKSGIDLKVGCVGYGGDSHAIDGALNLTSPQALSAYLNKATGVQRTMSFGGSDADKLLKAAQGSDKYENGAFNESGVLALRFANDVFSFRKGANRIYINFTDEANQPNGNPQWSVEYLNPAGSMWTSEMGTVHTVFSNAKADYSTANYEEAPWKMSEYTGGTVIYTDPAFEGVTLSSLPVTGAMQNAYLIRFGNIAKYMDDRIHNVKVTVISADGGVHAERNYPVIFSAN